MVASALSFIPPEYHADILAGTSTVDVASYLNSGLSQEKTLQLPTFGQMSIASTVFVPSGGGILGDNFGCTLKALANFGNIAMIQNATPAPTTNTERDRNIVLRGIRLDGNKVANTTATEFGHGIKLNAVDGVKLDVQVLNPKGDGVSLQQSVTIPSVGCSDVTGKIRTEGCARQGTAITCGEQIDLDIYDTGGSLMSVDVEPDDARNFIRNVFIRLLSVTTGDGTDTSGGIAVGDGATGAVVAGVTMDFEIINSRGQGIIWRGVKDLVLRGTIISPAGTGLFGTGFGAIPSRVFFENVRVIDPVGSGLVARETAGSIYDGEIVVVGAQATGVQIENAGGGSLRVTAQGTGQQGLYLRDTSNMTFPSAIVERSGSHNVWITGKSMGNRFPFLKAVASSFGAGFLEEAGCNDNKASFARVSGNANGNVVLSGAQSAVSLEP